MIRWRVFVAMVAILMCSKQKWRVLCQYNNVIGADDTLLLPLADTRPSNCECGKLTKKIDDERLAKVKIAGGRVPWLAELITTFDSVYNEPEEFRLCFGTMISLQTLVFPASCIDTFARKRPQVKLLGVDSRKEAIRDVASFLIHPQYRRKTDNDIALVKLKEPIDFNQTKVVPICLPNAQKNKYPVKYPGQRDSVNGTFTIKIWNGSRIDEFANSAEDEEEDPSRVKPCQNPKPPCERRPCPPCNSSTSHRPLFAKPKPPQYQLKFSVPRTWFFRKGPGYDYIQYYGRFDVDKVNDTKCHRLFPEMLQSKVTCVHQKENRDIAKQNAKFFSQIELGMPLFLANTTLVKGKPAPVTTKYYLDSIRAPGSSGGFPLLGSRENTVALLQMEDYIPWIQENSYNGHFCKL